MKFQNFLIEAKRKKLYFAHPRAYYDKPEEKKAIAMIMKEFPDYIIVNPNVSWIQGRVDDMGFDIFFKVIDTVDFIVAMPFPDGKMGNGTWREIEYGDKKGKDIYVVRPQKNTLEKTPKNKIKWITPEETYERIPKAEQEKWEMYESKNMKLDWRPFVRSINSMDKKSRNNQITEFAGKYGQEGIDYIKKELSKETDRIYKGMDKKFDKWVSDWEGQ